MPLTKTFGQGRLFLLGVFLLFPPSASTQDLDIEEKGHSNSLKAGSWALQFEINKDFKFDGFQGLLISTKRHFSNKRAIRFGLGISSDISDVVLSNTQRQADTLVSRDSDQSDSSSFAFEIATQYISYPSPTKQVNVFFGGGPHFRFGDSNFETRDSISFSKRGTSSWAMGVSLIFGAEWFINDRISLLGEYGAFIGYENTTKTMIDKTLSLPTFENRKTIEVNSIKFQPSSVRLGLSFYLSAGKDDEKVFED